MATRTACLGLAVFSVAYVATAMFPLPVPTLDPGVGTWRWGGRAHGTEIRYYGQVLAAVLAALAAVVPLQLGKRGRPEVTTPTDWLFAAWAAAAAALCMAYHAWHNWP